MKTKLKTKILTFILIFNVLTLSFVPCVNTYKTEAAAAGAATIAQIAGYIMSVTGFLNVASNGGVSKATGSQLDSLKAKISDLMGTGIYQDSNGDYVFTGQATQELYNALSSNDNYNARVVSNFFGSSPVNSLPYTGSAYTNSNFKSYYSTRRSQFDDVLMFSASFISSSTANTKLYTVDMSNVSFCVLEDYSAGACKLSFYNSSGTAINCDVYCDTQITNTTSGSYNTVTTEHDTYSYIFIYYKDVDFNINHIYRFPLFNPLNFGETYQITNIDSFYNNFPFITPSHNYSCFYCNRSMILTKNYIQAMNLINQKSGAFYGNKVTVIPKVSQNVVNNNNWNEVYNSYYNNINNNYNEYVTDGEVDYNKLRSMMAKYSTAVETAVNQGVENLEAVLADTNDWLRRIFDRLSILQDILSNMNNSSGGGSGCEWTTEQIQSVLDWLEDIECNTADLSYIYDKTASIDTKLGSVYTLLGQILSALQNGGGGGGTPSSPSYTIPNTKVPWDDLDDLTTDNITNYITNTQIIQGLIEDTAIFAYAVIIGDIVNGLATEPQVPQFNIPFEYDSGYTGVSFDYDFDLDLDDLHFENVHALLIAGECVLFTLYCAWLFLKLIQIVYEFLK